MKPTDDFPKVVWYGEASLSQRYFLLLLMELGCDVLIFHPAKIDEFAEIDPNDSFSITYAYSNQTTLQPFPDKLRDRQATVGYRSSQHFEQLMHDQQSGVYKPWQFKDFMPRSLTLRMTYDDIFIYAKEKLWFDHSLKWLRMRLSYQSYLPKLVGFRADVKNTGIICISY